MLVEELIELSFFDQPGHKGARFGQQLGQVFTLCNQITQLWRRCELVEPIDEVWQDASVVVEQLLFFRLACEVPLRVDHELDEHLHHRLLESKDGVVEFVRSCVEV